MDVLAGVLAFKGGISAYRWQAHRGSYASPCDAQRRSCAEPTRCGAPVASAHFVVRGLRFGHSQYALPVVAGKDFKKVDQMVVVGGQVERAIRVRVTAVVPRQYPTLCLSRLELALDPADGCSPLETWFDESLGRGYQHLPGGETNVLGVVS